MRLSSIISAIRLIQQNDKRWVPESLRGLGFFGKLDEWIFVSSDHENMCEDCAHYNGQVFYGDELRTIFPYLEVRDANLIYPRVHPHCGCELVRLTKNLRL